MTWLASLVSGIALVLALSSPAFSHPEVMATSSINPYPSHSHYGYVPRTTKDGYHLVVRYGLNEQCHYWDNPANSRTTPVDIFLDEPEEGWPTRGSSYESNLHYLWQYRNGIDTAQGFTLYSNCGKRQILCHSENPTTTAPFTCRELNMPYILPYGGSLNTEFAPELDYSRRQTDRLYDKYGRRWPDPAAERAIPPAFRQLPMGYHASFYATSSPFKSVRDYLSGATSTATSTPSSRILGEAYELIYSFHSTPFRSGCSYQIGMQQYFPHGVYYVSCLGNHIAGIYCSEWPEHAGIHLHCTNDLRLTPRRITTPTPSNPTPEPEPTATSIRTWLEVPANGSFQSGIGYVSGWACEAERVAIVIDGGLHLPPVARNIARGDTEAVCGDQDNGFITQWNWNLMGEGTYTAALVVDGQTMQSNTFTVTTMGQEFIKGLERDVEVQDFPSPGEITRLRWQEPVQGFVLVPGSEPTPASPTATSTRARLEVPGNGSFQSGIGFVSGWACEGELVEIVIDGGLRIPPVARNISRGDTEAACGDQTNGFITQWNWNLLGDGTYTAALVVDGRTIQENRFTVTTLGEEFVRGVERDVVVNDFPAPDEDVLLRWQEPVQGFVLVPAE